MPNLNEVAAQVSISSGENIGEVKKIIRQAFLILAEMEEKEVKSILRRYGDAAWLKSTKK